jgi:GT2 family glycosyltransferase
VKTTILLLATDEAPLLARSLPAASAQGPQAEVVVIDNASVDDTAELTRRHGVGYLRLEPRRPYAAAMNEGIARTDGDAVLLLNPDCFLRPGFLDAALPRLAEDSVGAVAPKLLRVSAPGAAPEEIDAAGMFLTRWRKNGLLGFGAPIAGYSTPGQSFGADGAAALYRRAVLDECALQGGEVLDEDMVLYATDVDLAWRAQLLGWRCAYEPRAVAEHVRSYSPATRWAISPVARRQQFRNRYLMMAKNETGRGLRRDGLLIAGYEALALGHVVLREPHLLAGYREAWRLLPGARRRRAQVQARRRVELPPFGLRPPE